MSEYAVVDHAGVISNLQAFFTGIGWTVTGTALNPIVAPVGGTKSYGFTQTAQGLTIADVTDSTFRAVGCAPLEVATASPTFAAPTRLFAYGETDWAALIIQYGPNSYRHHYIGVLSKVGNYIGGDVVCCNAAAGYNGASISLQSFLVHYLFDGYTQSNLTITGTFPNSYNAETGAVYVSHPDLTNPIKKYHDTRHNLFTEFQPDTVYGAGNGQVETDRRMANAVVPGGVVLVPMNHVVTDGDHPNMRLYPIGHPKGVRATSVRDIAPEEQHVVGVDTWKFFPEFTKTNSAIETRLAGDTYTKGRNSFYMGLAYKVVG